MKPNPLLIALDYDGTIAADEELWEVFVRFAQGQGHRVFIATARGADDIAEVQRWAAPMGLKVIATNGRPKIKDVDDQAGYLPDIWIDDQPHWLFRNVVE